jgi:hypothetical protein
MIDNAEAAGTQEGMTEAGRERDAPFLHECRYVSWE